jgi:hypothetical protein
VVTEAGFGADIGCEKFFNIKCRASGLVPNAAVVVTTVRALKMHSGRFKIVPGKPLDPALEREDLEAIEAGIGNLEKQLENVAAHGIPAVVAINKFPGDTDREHDFIRKRALDAGAFGAEVSEVFGKGGEGGLALASHDAACERRQVPLPVPARGAGEGEGRDHRPPHVRRRRHRLERPGERRRRALREARLRQPADLHGEDPPLALGRPREEGPSDGLPPAGPRGAPVGRRRLPLPALRRDADHARPRQQARPRERGPRRQRQHRRLF